MSRHIISVAQLVSSGNGRVFFNVEEDVYGAIGVWGSLYKTPTYLFKEGIQFVFIQFEDQACADEWLAENRKEKELIWSSVDY